MYETPLEVFGRKIFIKIFLSCNNGAQFKNKGLFEISYCYIKTDF